MHNAHSLPAHGQSRPELSSGDLSKSSHAGLLGALVLSGGLLLALIGASMWLCGQHLVYTLDDPYIHLTLARNIQAGSYGINPGEWASPSSSILWPVILALFPAPIFEWAPLLINTLCCLFSVALLESGLRGTALPAWARAVLATALAVGMNLLGLVLTGMEHSLQIALALLAAQWATRARLSLVAYGVLIAMPLIRYECLAIAFPILALQFLKGDRIRALLAGAVISAVVLGFSWMLHAQGLPWLPCSVLAKTEAHTIRALVNWQGQPALIALVAWLVYQFRGHPRELLLLVLAPSAGYFALGASGWYGRYEVFYVAYMAMLAIQTLHKNWAFAQAPSGAALGAALGVLAMAGSFPSLIACTVSSPRAAQNIWLQQTVMARIASQLGEPVAVNDLGVVALHSGQRVLDLGGLGSYEALLAHRKALATPDSNAWVGQLMARHSVQFAFIYDKSFPGLPPDMKRIGQLVTPGKMITPFSERVALYAVGPQASERLLKTLKDFQANDPQGSQVVLDAPVRTNLPLSSPP
jgi:hypothetical protein